MATTQPKTKGCNIIKCKCHFPFQDEKYGKGNRLHNACLKGWRCTVCLSEKIV